jgi:hypothetical protein
MKTLLILTPVLLLSTLALVMINQSERDQATTEQQFSQLSHRLHRVEQDVKMGPKPYCMTHAVSHRGKKQQDSVIAYFSNMTYGELWEVKEAILDIQVKMFVDSIMAYKDKVRGSDITTRVPDE